MSEHLLAEIERLSVYERISVSLHKENVALRADISLADKIINAAEEDNDRLRNEIAELKKPVMIELSVDGQKFALVGE